MRTLAVILGLNCCLWAADQVPQKAMVANTQHLDLPSGGTVRLKHSTGELTIEGWDEPGVELTTIKSTKVELLQPDRDKAAKELEQVKISAQVQGNELVISMDYPEHRRFPAKAPIAVGGVKNFKLESHLKVPRDAKLIVNQDVGDVHFDGVTGDIEVTAIQGEISLLLAADGQYSIDAKSKVGSVISDFPGSMRRRHLFGHEFTQGSQAPHKLYLREGFGDIVIMKAHHPALPAPLSQ